MDSRSWRMRSKRRFLAGRSEQALDRQPAQDADLDAFPETGLGLGVEADLLVTLASCPFEAVSHKFDAIRVAIDIALGVHRQTLREPRTIEEQTHLGVQFARARIEIVGPDKTNPPVEGEGLGVQTCTARPGRSAEATRSPLVEGASGRLEFVEFDAGLDQRFAIELVFCVHRNSIRCSQRIGDHDNPGATLANASQKFDALLPR